MAASASPWCLVRGAADAAAAALEGSCTRQMDVSRVMSCNEFPFLQWKKGQFWFLGLLSSEAPCHKTDPWKATLQSGKLLLSAFSQLLVKLSLLSLVRKSLFLERRGSMVACLALSEQNVRHLELQQGFGCRRRLANGIGNVRDGAPRGEDQLNSVHFLQMQSEQNEKTKEHNSNGFQPTSDGLQPTSDASNLLAMASNLLAMASNLLAMASTPLAMPPTY